MTERKRKRTKHEKAKRTLKYNTDIRRKRISDERETDKKNKKRGRFGGTE